MMDGKRQYVVVVNSVREQAYQTLRNEIVSMELKPGTVISTQDIATRLNISRTPVREAFIRLQGESLLEISPQKATVVSRIDFNRVNQERFIREALEVQNMYNFATAASADTIKAMRENIKQQYQALHAEDYAKYLELDNSFHQLEFTDTHEDLAASLIRQMNGHYDRVRLISSREQGVADTIIREHEQLVDYVSRKDVDSAVGLLQRHIRELQSFQHVLVDKWDGYFVQNQI